jgi:myo-inositol-1(or 4)-monophosphatase
MTPNTGFLIDHMSRAARAAGALTLDAFRDFRRMEIGHKGPADFVTDSDRASEQLIREHLRPLGADWSFRGEEFAPYSGSDPHHEWLVDPIDGTTNFINGLDYTISIALRRDGETVCGVLYNPVADEMFTVERGSGAFANGKRLTVSDRVDPRLFNIGTGLPTSGLFTHGGFYSRLDRIRDQIGAIRIIGSSANSCAHVADGRLTGYFRGIRPPRLGGGRAARYRGGWHRDGLVEP